MFNRAKSFKFITAACFLSTVFSFSPCTAVTNQLEKTEFNFVNAAKKATPAVVSIKVKTKAPQSSSSFYFNGKKYEGDELDPFGDSFFQQFFGGPRKRQEQQESSGQASGFIVSEDGYILTNGHVVKDATEIVVVMDDGTEFPAKVIGADSSTDIAVIKIDAKGLPFLTLGNSDELEVGQWVMAIGTPFGLKASVTSGIVSAKGRNNLDLAQIEDFIQTDAAINRGNSGGPLLTLDGEVIGMNTAIATSMGSGGYVGVGFAIPSNLIHHIMNELMTRGSITRGFLGVSLQQITADLAAAFGLKNLQGALVADVVNDSPASKAGLKRGDVILEYNGKKVQNIANLRNAISLMNPGTSVNLRVIRDGRDIPVTFVIGSYPTENTKASLKADKFGFEVENLTPEMARNLGYLNQSGVIVTKVESGSPASWVGIKKGTLIVSVNNQEVKSVEQFNQAVKSAEANKPVLFLVKQGDATSFVSIKMQ